MNRSVVKSGAVIFLLLLAGCASEQVTFQPSDAAVRAQAQARPVVQEVLRSVRELEIVAIDPVPFRAQRDAPEPPPAAQLHGYKILGSAWVRDPKIATELTQALAKEVVDSTARSFACFSPRHALRFRQADQEVVIIICFECMKGEVYRGAGRTAFMTTSREEGVFDRIFKQFGLPKAP